MGMGRPREFDVEERLDHALEVFWARGYEGTTLSDLTDAMGINRPSLYAAYGNKESLFYRVLDRYLDGPAGHIRAALDEPTARATSERLLRGAVDVVTARDHRGCLITQGALSTGEVADPIRDELISRRRASEAGLSERFARAQTEGEIPPETNTADLARYITMVSYGLSVQATNGASPDELHRTVDMALTAWPRQ